MIAGMKLTGIEPINAYIKQENAYKWISFAKTKKNSNET